MAWNLTAVDTIASGSYDVGLETLQAESFIVTDRRTIHVHPGTGAEARLLTINQRQRNRPVTLAEALDHLDDAGAKLLVNERSAAPPCRYQPPASCWTMARSNGACG